MQVKTSLKEFELFVICLHSQIKNAFSFPLFFVLNQFLTFYLYNLELGEKRDILNFLNQFHWNLKKLRIFFNSSLLESMHVDRKSISNLIRRLACRLLGTRGHATFVVCTKGVVCSDDGSRWPRVCDCHVLLMAKNAAGKDRTRISTDFSSQFFFLCNLS